VLVGQRPQRLGRDRPVGRLHGQLTAAAGDHLAADREQVAEVHQRLEPGQRLLADVGQRQHHLQLGAVALAQPDEAELAGVAQEHHAPGHRDLLAGPGVRLELPSVVRRPDLGQGVGPLDGHGVGRAAFLQQPFPLAPTHPHLLGEVVLHGLGRRVLRSVAHAPSLGGPMR